MAQLKNVYKSYGQVKAVDGVSLVFSPGEVLALLGPNGAGKTTLIDLILGLRQPDRGEVTLFGLSPKNPASRQRVGATPQRTSFPNNLTVCEVIDLVRVHFQAPRSTTEVLQSFELVGLGSRQVGGLSDGQKRRLAVALAFAGNPKAVFLDEPTTGLDVESRHKVWAGIQMFRASGGAVLLSSHYLEEVEQLATRVAILNRGRIIATDSVEAIKKTVNVRQVRFLTDVEHETWSEFPGVVQVDHNERGYTLYTNDADKVVRALFEREIAFQQLEIVPASLEQAFLILTGEKQ